MAVADDRRRTGDCRLDGVLQEEVFAQAEHRRDVILQTVQRSPLLRVYRRLINRQYNTLDSIST
jgi:hypothetical protein